MSNNAVRFFLREKITFLKRYISKTMYIAILGALELWFTASASEMTAIRAVSNQSHANVHI